MSNVSYGQRYSKKRVRKVGDMLARNASMSLSDISSDDYDMFVAWHSVGTSPPQSPG